LTKTYLTWALPASKMVGGAGRKNHSLLSLHQGMSSEGHSCTDDLVRCFHYKTGMGVCCTPAAWQEVRDALWSMSLLLPSLILCRGQDIRPQLKAKGCFCPRLHFGLANQCHRVPPWCLGPPGCGAGAQPTSWEVE